jgi:phenylalanyl-tRNA synthetase beta chain
MKVGYNWLKDYVAFEWSPSELAERLTSIGTAVDGIEPVFERFKHVVIGRIESSDPHPSRPELRVLSVDVRSGRKTIVCGAPNARPGLIVPVALPGAEMPILQGDVLRVREFDSVSSEGMCCSESELGLSPDAATLMELDPEEFTVGDDLWQVLALDEVTLSFELTPNRADCLSVFGIAREIAALVGARMRHPDIRLSESREPAEKHLQVHIEDPEGCPRYAARLVRKGVVRSSPFWLKRRLRSAGMRPINNAVDITNFVMMETGQPLHAFDFSKFPDGRVVVRSAAAGEEFVTLDDVTRKLPADAVMITNGRQNVAIGGIMGGVDSEVTPLTTSFLIEGAYFSPTRTRRARTRLGLATESALRFEKGADPNGIPAALDRAGELFARLTGGEVLGRPVDTYPRPIEPIRLDLDPDQVNRVLGTNLSTPSMISILASLEFGVATGKSPTITVPTFRADVTREIDLIEEIARIHGYEKIPVTRRAAGVVPTRRDLVAGHQKRARDILVGLGLDEIMGNSLTDPASTFVDPSRHVTLRNPLSSDLSILRPELFGSLLKVVAHNLNRQVDSIPIFELGRVFQLDDGEPSYKEQTELILGLCGQTPTAGWGEPARSFDFFDLKGLVTELMAGWGGEFSIVPGSTTPFLPAQGYVILTEPRSSDLALGQMGLIDPAYARRFGVKEPVWAAVIDFEMLSGTPEKVRQYVPLPRFPAAFRDLAVVVDETVSSGDVWKTIRIAGGRLLDEIRLFDRYSGPPIPAGKISLAFSVSYRHPDRTLTDDEAESAHRGIIEALRATHDALLRE